MDAIITGESERVGLSVVDNNGAEHLIEMDESGKIKYHYSDDYPQEVEERTIAENEHVEQARRFAQYYVYVERGHDTVRPPIHPERIDAVRSAVRDLTDAEFEELFGDLYQQCASYHDEGVDRVIPIPDEAGGPNKVFYRQHVYLGIDPTGTDLGSSVEDIAELHGLDLDGGSVFDRAVSTLTGSELDDWEAFGEDLAERAREAGVDISAGASVDAVSSLYTSCIDGRGVEYIGDPERDPFEREPDTLIELPPAGTESLQHFRSYFDHYLRCQVRDCFVRMGVEPPEPFRVLGFGHFEATEQYTRLSMFPDYHDPDSGGLFG